MGTTLMIWISRTVAGLLALFGLWVLYRGLLRDRSRGRLRCPKCWYDMVGIAGLCCPECGLSAKTPRHLLRTRRHWRPTAAGVVLLVMAGASAITPRAIRDPWPLVPTPVLFLVLSFYDDEADQLFARVAGMVRAGAKTTAWERLLLARACAKEIRERVASLETSQSGGLRGEQLAWSFRVDPQLVQATDLLTRLGAESRPAVTTLVGMLRSPHAPTRTLAVTTLGKIGPVTPAVAPAITTALDDRDFDVVIAAIGALAAFGRNQTIPVGRLIALLSDDRNWRARRAIAALLAKQGPAAARAAPVLERMAREDSGLFVKLAATDAIAAVEPPDRARARLVSLLEPSDPDLRVAAGRSLEKMGAAALPALPAITRATHEGSARLAGTGVDILLTFREAAVPHLAELARHEDPDVAGPAAGALGALGRTAAPGVPALVHALGHRERHVRLAAVNALERIGPPAAAAIPALERIAGGDDEVTAVAARNAVGALKGADPGG